MMVMAYILRCFFVALMLAAAFGKLLDMTGFIAVVNSYQALPVVLLAPAAWALALCELGIGLWLITGRRLALAALVVLILHIVYIAWLASAYARDLEIPNCGCFGVYWPRPLTAQTFFEDGVLLMLAAWWWSCCKQQRT